MEKTQHYRLSFQQGNIEKKDAEIYIRLLSEETLNYITNNSFDRRLLRPLMRAAQKTMEKQNPMQELDVIVNSILHDKREMFLLMNTFCL